MDGECLWNKLTTGNDVAFSMQADRQIQHSRNREEQIPVVCGLLSASLME